jgi:hypothetical protein
VNPLDGAPKVGNVYADLLFGVVIVRAIGFDHMRNVVVIYERTERGDAFFTYVPSGEFGTRPLSGPGGWLDVGWTDKGALAELQKAPPEAT